MIFNTGESVWTGVEVGTSAYTNGGFTISLTATVAAEHLVQMSKSLPKGVTMNAPDAMIAHLSNFLGYKEQSLHQDRHGFDAPQRLPYRKPDIQVIRQELTSPKPDIKVLRQELTSPKPDIKVLRQGLPYRKPDIKVLRQGLTYRKPDIKVLR